MERTILNRMVRMGLIVNVTFEQRLEESWRRAF